MTSSHSEPPQDGVPPSASGPAGELRPAAAPVIGRPWRHGVVGEHLAGSREPVDGDGGRRDDGPALETVRVRPGRRWVVALGWALGVEVLVTAVAALAGWTGDPGPALAAFLGGLFVVLFVWMAVREPVLPAITAGARWVRTGDDGPPVRLDRLTEIAGDSIPGEPYLQLTDRRGAVVLHLGLLQANPALWALVYAGITDGIARGARTDVVARERLDLPEDGRPRRP